MKKYIDGEYVEIDETYNFYEDIYYKDIVENLIREKYSVSDELALHRQSDTKPEEYTEYFNFCEQCKIKARELKNNG